MPPHNKGGRVTYQLLPVYESFQESMSPCCEYDDYPSDENERKYQNRFQDGERGTP